MKRMNLRGEGPNLIAFLSQMIAATYGQHELQVEMEDKAKALKPNPTNRYIELKELTLEELSYERALEIAREYFVFNEDSITRAEEIGGLSALLPYMTKEQETMLEEQSRETCRRALTFKDRLYEGCNDPLIYWFKLQPHLKTI